MEIVEKEKPAKQIISVLASVASDLQLLTDPHLVTAKEWLSYSEALARVREAIAALEKLDVSLSATELSPTESQPKKGLLARLREIKIDGKLDWSQRHNEIL